MNARLRYPLSLRWRLLLPLVVTAVIISILLFVTMRQVTKQAVQATQDALLSTAVSSILQQTRSRDGNVDIDLPYDIFTMLGAISQDKVYYRVDLDGVFLTGYGDLAPLMDGPLSDRPLLTSQSFKGEHVRQATIMQSFLIDGQAKMLRVTVAQTQLFQEAILREISRNASIIGLSFFGFAIFMALLVTTSFLRPINLLAGAVSRRGPHDLRDVKHPTPPELAPLLTSLNGFIGRLRSTLGQTETFIAEAAHHIRTPLSLVKSESQLVLRKSVDPDTRKHLHNVITSVDESIRSASQLLDHALVLYRNEQAQKDRLDLPLILTHVLSSMVPTADLKDITLNIDIDDSQPLWVMGDRVLLEVALRNLLDNAIKYSDPDMQVTVSAQRRKEFATIAITDQGRGIKGLDVCSLNNRFRRGSNVDDVIGSGLGLAITSEICTAMGGELTLTNNKGAGACAVLQLPAC